MEDEDVDQLDFNSDEDIEVRVIAVCVNALAQVDPDARVRVTTYLNARAQEE